MTATQLLVVPLVQAQDCAANIAYVFSEMERTRNNELRSQIFENCNGPAASSRYHRC